MSALTNYAENGVINHVLRNTAFTVSDSYIGLLTSAPDEDGSPTNEVVAAWYNRRQPSSGWNTATPSGITNDGSITWNTVTSSVTVTHIGLFDSLTSGNLLWYKALSSPKLFNGGQPTIADEGLAITVASGGMSNYLIAKILDHITARSAFTRPTSWYTAIYTSNPTAADSGTEFTGGGYSRKATTFAAPSNGTTSNSNDLEYGTASANLGTGSYWGVRDASSVGNLLFFGAIDSPLAVDDGDSYRILTGELDITIQ